MRYGPDTNPGWNNLSKDQRTTCFNCSRAGHSVTDCNEPIDRRRIKTNRKTFDRMLVAANDQAKGVPSYASVAFLLSLESNLRWFFTEKLVSVDGSAPVLANLFIDPGAQLTLMNSRSPLMMLARPHTPTVTFRAEGMFKGQSDNPVLLNKCSAVSLFLNEGVYYL